MMHTKPQLLINQLTYSISASRQLLFDRLSLALSLTKTGLVGRNGIGKSTLLRLIMRELTPHAGTIKTVGTLAYCPQQIEVDNTIDVATLLGIRAKLDALTRIAAGSLAETDFELVGDDWLLQENMQQQLELFGLGGIDLGQPVYTLSGGEKTRLLLTKTFLSNADFFLLDEPTNNLDSEARDLLYKQVMAWNKGLLIVSHDRTLLDLMEQILELTTLGAQCYGGNFTHYQEQKLLQLKGREQDFLDAKKSLAVTKASVQTTREKREKRQAYGRKLFTSGSIDKLSANAKRGQSEKTQQRLVKQNNHLLERAEAKLINARAKLEVYEEINVSLPQTVVPKGKMMLQFEQVSFAYPDGPALLEHYNLQLSGAARIALAGSNGCGKTTLIKLIMKELLPDNGRIYCGTERISYLDQHANLLNHEHSVLANFLAFQPNANEEQAHHALAQFLFRNTAALKLVKHLSGGEKLRAALACVLMALEPPQLLLLDEPTNHLDFASIASIESILNCYQGAMIVISHDRTFLKNIGIKEIIYAPFYEREIKKRE